MLTASCFFFFILHSSFFILHSSFFILHSSFFILHSSFFVLSSSTMHQAPYNIAIPSPLILSYSSFVNLSNSSIIAEERTKEINPLDEAVLIFMQEQPIEKCRYYYSFSPFLEIFICSILFYLFIFILPPRSNIQCSGNYPSR